MSNAYIISARDAEVIRRQLQGLRDAIEKQEWPEVKAAVETISSIELIEAQVTAAPVVHSDRNEKQWLRIARNTEQALLRVAETLAYVSMDHPVHPHVVGDSEK